MTDLYLPGITVHDVDTDRLRTRVLHDERESGAPVLLVHGNVSSSLFWQETLLALPPGFRGIAPDLRGFGGSETAPVDATRGLRDFSDDLLALIDALDLDGVHLVGWSMGGGVVLQTALDRPTAIASVTLVNPVSPYGFGGTTDLAGTRIADDDPGTGGGGANPGFVAALAEGDRGDGPTSPRAIMNSFYFANDFRSPLEDVLVESMLTTAIGDDNYPGDAVTSSTWPGFGAGTRGVLNTMAPGYFDVSRIVDLDHKPPILWVRGEKDAIVSDGSMFDLAMLGKLGAVPGWPGEQTCPPQPMVGQTRAVLQAYAAARGTYEEVVLDAGHSPHVERPEEFQAALAAHLAR